MSILKIWPCPPPTVNLPLPACVCPCGRSALHRDRESRPFSQSLCDPTYTRSAKFVPCARAHCAQLILPGWKWALATKRAFNRGGGGGDGDSACEPNKELFSPSMGTYTPQNKANCSLPLLSGAWKRFYFFFWYIKFIKLKIRYTAFDVDILTKNVVRQQSIFCSLVEKGRAYLIFLCK